MTDKEEKVMKSFSDLLGKTLQNVSQNGDEELVFTLNNGEMYVQHHNQDCCESVYIEDVCGDLNDLIGSVIIEAEEIIHENENPEVPPALHDSDDSFTWTFYKIGTDKGFVTIRWYGSSNGYYSERVDFERVE